MLPAPSPVGGCYPHGVKIPFLINVPLEYIVPTVLCPCSMYNLHNVFEYLAIVSTKGIVKSSTGVLK